MICQVLSLEPSLTNITRLFFADFALPLELIHLPQAFARLRQNLLLLIAGERQYKAYLADPWVILLLSVLRVASCVSRSSRRAANSLALESAPPRRWSILSTCTHA